VSKLYQMNRMMYAPAAGGLLSGIIKGAGTLIGGLFKKKGVQTAIQVATKVAKNPAVQTGAMIAGAELLSGGGGGRGASGGWTGRRRRGITATELRGYRKVAGLLHREGMVSKRARGRH